MASPLDGQPRWFVIGSTLLAVVALSVLGNYYHQWLLGIVAALGVGALTQAGYAAVLRRAPRRRTSSANQQAVIVHLTAPSSSTAQEEDLDTLETLLSDVIEREGLGEYDGNAMGAGVALYMYGASAERLFAGVERTLRSSALCRNARVLVRPGPPGTPAREVRL